MTRKGKVEQSGGHMTGCGFSMIPGRAQSLIRSSLIVVAPQFDISDE